MFVSIITPVYNSSRFISEMLESVLNQTYKNWELILVDDFSSDDSVKIIKEYRKIDSRIKLFLLDKNSGAGPARNKAIKESKGDIIAFLDSDDIWHSQKLERHVEFMIEKKALFSHTSYGFINEEGDIINKTFHVSNHDITYEDLLKRTEISCLTAMYNVREIGKMFMPDIRRKQDYALWLSILNKGFVSVPLDAELAFYRQVNGSATSNKFKLIFKHYLFLKEIQKLNFLKSIYFTFMWGINGVKKYYISKI